MRLFNIASVAVFLGSSFLGTESGAACQGSADSGTVDDGATGRPLAIANGAADSASRGAALSSAERVRLRGIYSDFRTALQSDDFALVERALLSSNFEDRQSACLAVEKICYYMEDIAADDPERAAAGRLAERHLNREYIDRNFPRLLDAADSGDSDLAEFASRAIGALATDTELLNREQVAQSCDKALAFLGSDDFEDRRRGVNLLGDLMSRLDLNNARQKQAIDQLLKIAEDWQRSYHGKWGRWQADVSYRGEAKPRFQHQAILTLLYNCAFIKDEAHAMRAYRFLTNGLESQTLNLQAVASIAALASRLPAAQRRNAVQLAIGGVSDERFWHDVGSGFPILRNYSADALCYLAPCLEKEEVQQALKAIESQRWSPEESKVFEAAKIALLDRLTLLK